MKTDFRIGYFELACVLGVIATMVAYSISEFHFMLTLLCVIVLVIVALIHDTTGGSAPPDARRGSPSGKSAGGNPHALRPVSPHGVPQGPSIDRQRSSK